MSAPPATWPSTRSAPTVNRASDKPMVLVRMHNGELVGRISAEFADQLLSADVAEPVGRARIRYLRLLPGITIVNSTRGWMLIDEQCRKHGNNAVRQGLLAWERPRLKWQR